MVGFARASGCIGVMGGTLAVACSSNVPSTTTAPNLDTDPTVLGAVTRPSSVACPADAAADATCTAVTVTCPKLDDLDAVVAVSEPTTPALGTVYLHDNVGGTSFMDDGFVGAYVAAGLRVVQVKWQSDWEASSIGIKHAACRYATLLAWAFTDVHGADRSKGFCAQSWGGGSGGLALALAHYGAGAFVDAVTVSAGPPFARIDLGCDPAAAARSACPEIPDAPVAYSGGVLSIISGWEVAPTCGTTTPSSSEVQRWQNDSVLSPGAVTTFPSTSFAGWYCVNGADATVGQGSLLFDALQADKSVHCVTGGAGGATCSGQTPWPSALPDMANDLASRCIPNH
jgi:hypothetical protein